MIVKQEYIYNRNIPDVMVYGKVYDTYPIAEYGVYKAQVFCVTEKGENTLFDPICFRIPVDTTSQEIEV